MAELLPCEVHPLWMNCECWKVAQAKALHDKELAQQEQAEYERQFFDRAEQLRLESAEKRALLKNVDEFRTAVARMAARIDDSDLSGLDRASLTDALANIVISVGMEELVGGW